MSEICETCYQPYETVYRVPNGVWARIAPRKDDLGPYPEHQYGGLLCPDCATKAARGEGIDLFFEASQSDWAENERQSPNPAPIAARDARVRAEALREAADKIQLPENGTAGDPQDQMDRLIDEELRMIRRAILALIPADQEGDE